MLRGFQALPQPRLGHELIHGIGIGEEDGLGELAQGDGAGFDVAGESGGRGEVGHGFDGGVDYDGPGGAEDAAEVED
jgi:hypothetical protein